MADRHIRSLLSSFSNQGSRKFAPHSQMISHRHWDGS